jgi:phosphocarrier protein
MTTNQKTVKIQNVRGLHARATAEFVKLADTFSGEVYVTNEQGLRVNGKSIMGLLMLGASMGTTLTIEAEGESSDEILEKLIDLVNNKFGEDA